MGSIYRYYCEKCDHPFQFEFGGGFRYETYTCTDCGQQKGILREASIPPCSCGGNLGRNHPPKCPKCGSSKVLEGRLMMHSD
jgi:ssDNA-binding Zn-finger/Zn-ribbon topoisomerase 1